MELITHSPDLKRLYDEGYEVQVKQGHLIIHSVPYLNSNKELVFGILVSPLETDGTTATYSSTSDHIVYFAGSHPCDENGDELKSIKNNSENKELLKNLWVDHRFSARPDDNYRDYHHKMTTYIKILNEPLINLGIQVDARTFNPLVTSDDSPFHFSDTNSARAGMTAINDKVAGQKIAIIGLGGTGSYVLDFVAKMPVAEIHLFDGDVMLSHNAFRAPGSPTKDELRQIPSKVEHHSSTYSKMHKGVKVHPYHIDQSNYTELAGFDFVFLCMDGGGQKQQIKNYLTEQSIPYVDVGLSVRAFEGRLRGQIRTTLVNPKYTEALTPYMSLDSSPTDKEIYESNAQIAELNALNACFAVIAWKRLNGIYDPIEPDHIVFKLRNNGIACYED